MNSVFICKTKFISDKSHLTSKLYYIDTRDGTVLDEWNDMMLVSKDKGVYLRRKSDGKGIKLHENYAIHTSLEELFDQDEHLYSKVTEDIRNYVKYHHERPGSQGIFSDGKEIDFEEEKESVHNHIDQSGAIVWDWVLSLREDDHEALGMNKKKWQDVLKKAMPKIAKDMGIDNLHWYAAHHYKKGHPHVHLMFYDLDNKVQRGKIPSKKLARLKGYLFNEIAYEEKKVLYSSKKTYEDKIISKVATKLSNYQRVQLATLLKKSNRFRYRYLDPFTKSKVDKFIDSVLNEPEIRDDIINYNDRQADIIKIFDKDKESVDMKVNDNFNKVMLPKIRNSILKSIKDEIVNGKKTITNKIDNQEQTHNNKNFNDKQAQSSSYDRQDDLNNKQSSYDFHKVFGTSNDISTNKGYLTQDQYAKRVEQKQQLYDKKQQEFEDVKADIHKKKQLSALARIFNNNSKHMSKADREREQELAKIRQQAKQLNTWESYI